MHELKDVSENTIQSLKKSFHKLLLRQPFTKAALQRNYKKIVIGSLVFCLMIGLAAAYYVKTQYKEFADYQIELHSPSEQDGMFLMGEKGEIIAQVRESTPARFSMTHLKGLKLKITFGSDTLQQEVLDTIPKLNSPVSKTLQFDPAKVGDGVHEVTVYLSDADNPERVFAHKTASVMRDTVEPLLHDVTTTRGNLSRYALDNTDKASSSAVVAKNGIKVLSNSSEAFTLKLSFSELVRPVLDNLNLTASAAGTVVFAESPAATLSAVFTPGTKNLSLPVVFQDVTGNKLVTEIQFVLDAVAPKLNLSNQYTVLESNRNDFSFSFSASEPLAFVKATANGVTKNATGNYKSYQVSGLPMSQDKNTVKLIGQDLAGNVTAGEVTVNVTKPAPTPPPSKYYYNPANGKYWTAPSDARHCDDKDKRECGYENVSDMSCEEFKVVKDCLKTRCPYDGYSLGSCQY